MSLRPVFNPSLYHGESKKGNFFEGWYFKLIDRERKRSCAVIPGVSLAGKAEKPHAFIQFLFGKEMRSDNFIYDFDRFRYDKKRFDLHLGGSHFSSDSISLDLVSPENRIRGEVRFLESFKWPSSLLSPGIMGPVTFVPFMECYHGVVSMDHLLEGQLEVNGQRWDFTGGRGYIEKDWGRSFPQAWIWMQSNSFSEPGVSFMLSVARIPWLGRSFTGFLCGLLRDGELLRFTTYKMARIRTVEVSSDAVRVEIAMSRFLLKVFARRTGGAPLLSPVRGSMRGRINETLTSEISIELYENGRPVFKDTGSDAGLEVVGELKVPGGGIRT